MEAAFAHPIKQVLANFNVDAGAGLTATQVVEARKKHGSNCSSPGAPLPHRPSLTHCAAIPEEPPTPVWELILEQFKDQLVIILLGSAVVSFVLALFEEEGGWSAFVDPAVVRKPSAL